MEFEYVVKAVRRFWPIVLLPFVLGVIAGQFLQPSSAPRYESAALVIVVPSADVGGNAEGDRYVASQLVVLKSPPLAARAAQLAGVSLAEVAAPGAVSFVQISGTDVVSVIASSSSPTDAQAIANAYLDAYLERTGSDPGSDQPAEPAELDESLAEIERQLDEIDVRIQDVMAPFVRSSTEADVAIPTVEQVAPVLATEREVLLETYRGLLSQRTSLEFQPETPTGSQAIQRAELPTAPMAKSSPVLTLALPIVGLLFGVVAATVLARASRRVLDDAEVSDVLATPFAAVLPTEQVFRSSSTFKLRRPSEEYRAVVNELCVQVEARGKIDTPITVLVTGSQRDAGATTLAAAIAARFGELGSRVLVVDLDFDRPDLSVRCGVEGDGISALIDNVAIDTAAVDARSNQSAFTPTASPNISVVGRRPGPGQIRPQRSELLTIMDSAVGYADVVVFDAGPMLAAPAAAVLAQYTDTVVLAVPVWSQERSSLRVIARQLAPVKARLLPVAVPRLKRPHRTPVSPSPVVDANLDEADDAMTPVAH